MYKQVREQAAVSRPQLAHPEAAPRGSRWGLYLPALFFLAVVLWIACLPVSVGTALAGAATATVFLFVRYRVALRWERLYWGLAVLVLLAAEVGVAVAAHQRANSFLFGQLTPDGQLLVTAQGNAKMRSGMLFVVDWDQFAAMRSSHVVDPERLARVVQPVPLGFIAPGTSRIFSIRPVAPERGVAHYRLIFSADTGGWWEDLATRDVGSQVLQALRVIRPRNLQPAVLYRYEQPGFLSRDREVNWAWAEEAP